MSIQQAVKAILDLSDEDKAKLLEALSSLDNQESEPASIESPQNLSPAKANKRRTKRASKSSKNKFEDSKFFTACQEDKKIDELFWKGREPSNRRKAARQVLVDVECSICKKKCKAEKSEVFFMSRDEYSYTCPKCVGGGRR